MSKHNTYVMEKIVGKDNAGVISSSQWRVFCFITHRADNVIKEWLKKEKVSKTQIAIFQSKLDFFENGGPSLSPGLISDGPVAKHIYKMKIKGNKGHVQLRPMLLFGLGANEITLLVGAIEKDGTLNPPTCKVDAQENRVILISNPHRRRRERID
jgi:hypothetical protein